MNRMEKNPAETKTQEAPQTTQEQTPNPNACRYCGFITPFDPNTPGYCCPSCGGFTFAR